MTDLERIKPILDRLGKKETTHKDIENFINLIEHNLIKKFLKFLKWYRVKGFQQYKSLDEEIKKWEKILKECRI